MKFRLINATMTLKNIGQSTKITLVHLLLLMLLLQGPLCSAVKDSKEISNDINTKSNDLSGKKDVFKSFSNGSNIIVTDKEGSEEILDESSAKKLSRRRRFLIPNNSGWTFVTIFSLRVPIRDVGSTLAVTLPFIYTFDTGLVTGRSLDSSGFSGLGQLLSSDLRMDTERLALFSTAEKYVRQFMGLDGRACVLRALCEIAQVPSHEQGLMGDALNLLILPSQVLADVSSVVSENVYLRAQRRGRVDNDCSEYTDKCAFSFFHFLEGEQSNSIDDSLNETRTFAATKENNEEMMEDSDKNDAVV